MMKKVMIGTIVILSIGMTGVYANPDELEPAATELKATVAEMLQVSGDNLKLVNLDRDLTVSKKELLLELTGEKGAEISIFVYYNVSLEVDKKNYVLAYDPIELVIGDMKRDWAELDLKRGSNKIVVVATYEDGSTETIVRYVDVKRIEEVQKEAESSISNPIKNLTGK